MKRLAVRKAKFTQSPARQTYIAGVPTRRYKMTKGLRYTHVELCEHGEHNGTADIWSQRTSQ